jgi:hypothetical protein
MTGIYTMLHDLRDFSHACNYFFIDRKKLILEKVMLTEK